MLPTLTPTFTSIYLQILVFTSDCSRPRPQYTGFTWFNPSFGPIRASTPGLSPLPWDIKGGGYWGKCWIAGHVQYQHQHQHQHLPCVIRGGRILRDCRTVPGRDCTIFFVNIFDKCFQNFWQIHISEQSWSAQVASIDGRGDGQGGGQDGRHQWARGMATTCPVSH